MTPGVNRGTSLEELAAMISGALESAGIVATLSGGAAITFYAGDQYVSSDLDFVTDARMKELERALAPLGYTRRAGAREFEHPCTAYLVEFPPSPIAFGETVVSSAEASVIETAFGRLRIVTPTQIVMDRLAAFAHWHDRQSWDQAVMVAKRQEIDWDALREWADNERLSAGIAARLKRDASRS